jgi:hypothetical protein
MKRRPAPFPLTLAPWLAFLLGLLALLPVASAGTQDPATFPEGISGVAHTAVEAAQDFEVAVQLADDLGSAAQRVTVTVCRFSAVDAGAPDVCYMNLGATEGTDAWLASTAAVEHPEWRDGWILGYKVTVKTASGEVHAPDRLAPNGEPDYYRLVVGEPDEPVPEGSAVVEDSPAAGVAGPAEAGRESPASALAALLGAGLAAGARASRRR